MALAGLLEHEPDEQVRPALRRAWLRTMGKAGRS
jgi:hypothetical protein